MSKVPIRKKRARQAFWQGRVKARPCLNCGGKGPHFVPPSLGEKGFYICGPREER